MLNLNAISDRVLLLLEIVGRGYNETQGHLRKFLMNDYGNCIRALVDHKTLLTGTTRRRVILAIAFCDG